MKILVLFLASIMLFMSSCTTDKKKEISSDNEVSTESNNGIKQDSNVAKPDKLALMIEATPLPNYMNLLLKNSEELGVDDVQLKKLKESSDVRSPQAVKIATQIAKNRGNMYQQSLAKASKEELLVALDQNLELSIKIAVLKTECRDEVIEILNDEQWKKLLDMYKKKMPFDDKTDIMKLVKHINPVPNYMQLINNPDLKLDAAQDKKVAEWQKVNNPKIGKLLKSVNSIEKDIYEISMKEESKEKILSKVDEINELKKQILIIKTDCRDNLLNLILSNEQWEVLVK